MPLNKLENFIKNTEGRILYVNPNDIDSTDAITNQGNSLAQPFKTIQRALLESARFSYVLGKNNDLIERTTILIYPGEHEIDNRPGFGIKVNPSNANNALAVSPSGAESDAATTLTLNLTSNFDIDQEDNSISETFILSSGSNFLKNEINCNLNGKHSSAFVNGIFLLNEKKHHLSLIHISEPTRPY